MKRGIAFSVEALLAALILFTIILFSSTMAGYVAKPYPHFDQLQAVADDFSLYGARSGAFVSALKPSLDDSQAKAVIDFLPQSICGVAEIYNTSVAPQNLVWAYASANCSGISHPYASSLSYFVIRQNSSSLSFFASRVAVWPRSG